MLATVIDLGRQLRGRYAQGGRASGRTSRRPRPAPGFDRMLLPGEPRRRAAASRRAGRVDQSMTRTGATISRRPAKLGITEAEIAARWERIKLLMHGWVAEWLKAAVLKTANPQGFVGSNPTPSAKHKEHHAALWSLDPGR